MKGDTKGLATYVNFTPQRYDRVSKQWLHSGMLTISLVRHKDGKTKLYGSVEDKANKYRFVLHISHLWRLLHLLDMKVKIERGMPGRFNFNKLIALPTRNDYKRCSLKVQPDRWKIKGKPWKSNPPECKVIGYRPRVFRDKL